MIGPRRAVLAIAALALASGIALLLVGPIPQDPAYHGFADARTLLDIPNALNVLSNLPFLLVGIWGLSKLSRRVERLPWLVFSLGLVLTALGSAWYHAAPGNESLFWDRLPLAITLMALLSALIGERLGTKAGLFALGPLLALGAASVIVWILTERAGRGDLRLYAFVQFFPMAAIPVLLVSGWPRFLRNADWWIALGAYAAAKVFELGDEWLFSATNEIISGHTLKHLAAAAGVGWLTQAFLCATTPHEHTTCE